jgi:predicted enzyme related to lactoylglutathione lyase
MENHKIVHVELSAKDRKALSKFYADIFGWKIEHLDDLNYSTFEAGDGIGGGFNPVTDQTPAGTVTVYIQTEDVTASLKDVQKAGGGILVPESDIPGMGKFGMFRDPQGNMIGLYKAYPRV